MTVGTYSPWEPTATLRSGAVGSEARGSSRRPQREERGGDIVAAPAQLVHHVSESSRPLIFAIISAKVNQFCIFFHCHIQKGSAEEA